MILEGRICVEKSFNFLEGGVLIIKIDRVDGPIQDVLLWIGWNAGLIIDLLLRLKNWFSLQ